MSSSLDEPGSAPADTVHVVAAAIIVDRTCLVALRSPTMTTPNLWELPGGKVHAGEDPRKALRREIDEELGLEIAVTSWIGRSVVEIGTRTICLDLYRAVVVGGGLDLREHAAVRWISADETDQLAWAPADRPLLEQLARTLGSNQTS